eukprot:TRINITY_DN33479_c0_g1_i1.p1 TRINITY_DN33479_c0_g1~~TRINITY_DN33479_c0_g1_i1.p1  ORF type:complete len:791 (-),score=77.99 TRINITY_DN33479_c0_g1_i1:274-2616(-)
MTQGKVQLCRLDGSSLLSALLNTLIDLPTGVRGLIYGLLLVYCFLGVAIIADTFVGSIEAITRRRKKLRSKDGVVSFPKVWNATVANLSLMALGSSAPEICLSCIEIWTSGMYVGDLGPSTIVGSAAFNLFVIIAFCIIAIPPTEGRQIKDLPAFFITAAFSVFAYCWLVFILVIVSPHVVDVWEAVLTLLFLPLLVWVSWKVDTSGGDKIPILRDVVAWTAGCEAEPAAAPKASRDFVDILRFAILSQDVEGEGDVDKTTLKVVVNREGGRVGTITCSYQTEELDAVRGYDYEHVEGTLEFSDGVLSQSISVEVFRNPLRRTPREVLVVLEVTEGSAQLGEADSDCMVFKANLMPWTDSSGSSRWRGIKCLSVLNIDSLRVLGMLWLENIQGVPFCGGSKDDHASASRTEKAFHFLCLPWKVIFATIPPPPPGGNLSWLCFVLCLVFIFGITAILADLAELFGCVLSIPGVVTALTFVALGTSMPDLFASLSAAREDDTADASVVNVTGSNSVNVFLGLGLPWTVASIYWAVVGRLPEWEEKYSLIAANIDGAAFIVESRNLGFSVLAFTACTVFCLIVIVARRKYIGAELGGPRDAQICSFAFLLLLWIIYVSLASWRVLRCVGASGNDWCKASIIEQAIVMTVASASVVLSSLCPAYSIWAHHRKRISVNDCGVPHDQPVEITLEKGSSEGSTSAAGSVDVAIVSPRPVVTDPRKLSIGRSGSFTSLDVAEEYHNRPDTIKSLGRVTTRQKSRTLHIRALTIPGVTKANRHNRNSKN